MAFCYVYKEKGILGKIIFNSCLAKNTVCIVLKKTIPSKYCDILSVLQNNLGKVVGKQ